MMTLLLLYNCLAGFRWNRSGFRPAFVNKTPWRIISSPAPALLTELKNFKLKNRADADSGRVSPVFDYNNITLDYDLWYIINKYIINFIKIKIFGNNIYKIKLR